jgi:hypothetical protein
VLDSTINDDNTIYASYNNYSRSRTFVNPNSPQLDRSQGYVLSFAVDLTAESHAKDDRAGFSVISASSDVAVGVPASIELGFQDGRIFAQNADFTAGEATTSFDPLAAGLVAYELDIQNDTYELRADGTAVLSGMLRDYTGFTDPLDPYETANFIFLGDNTSSARARVAINAVQVQVGSASGTLAFSQTAYSASEGNSATPATVVATITRTSGTTGAVSVEVVRADGSATPGDDYADIFPLTVNFADGETSQAVTLPVVGDANYEPDETLLLELRNPSSGALLGSPISATVTLINDDAPPVTIDSAPDDPTTATEATFVFSGPPDERGLARYECRLDMADWVACRSPQSYSVLGEGPHSFQIRAVASSGMPGEPAGHTWSVTSDITLYLQLLVRSS